MSLADAVSGRLRDKVAVVTGAGRGLGRAIAIAFAREGANVVVNYLQDERSASEVAAAISALGRRALLVRADVSKRESIRRMFSETIAALGRVDVLVNNAGINRRTDLPDVTDEEWDEIMTVNLKGPFICCQEVLPLMQKNGGGRIINMSSAAGQYHGPRTVHYAVAKAGLISLTKVVARYGAPAGILVNAIAPGIILTDQTRDEVNSAGGQRYIGMTLLGRFGEIQDVASTAVFLASDEQNYITGQVISVSGGAYLG